jgi:hypothetical protein
MANKKFNAHIWAGVKKFSSKSLNFCKNAYVVLMCLFVTIIRVVFIYNPIVFPIVMLFGHRKKAAEVLLGEKKTVVDEMWDVFPMFFCRWEVYCFPWFMRKHFVRIYPEKFSIEDQVKLAIELPHEEKKDFIQELGVETVSSLWQRHIIECNDIIVGFRSKLDVETLSYLINRGSTVKIKGYINKNTPSTECIQKMIGLTKLPNGKVAAEVLRYTAIKYGLSSPLIDAVYTDASEEAKKAVERALVQRNQYEIVCKLQKSDETVSADLWKAFCEQNPEIWGEAQKKMAFWMFGTYYATGHKLTESAIIHFLSTESTDRADIAELIFEKEDSLSDKVMSVIRLYPEIYTLYLKSSKMTGVGKV